MPDLTKIYLRPLNATTFLARVHNMNEVNSTTVDVSGLPALTEVTLTAN